MSKDTKFEQIMTEMHGAIDRLKHLKQNELIEKHDLILAVARETESIRVSAGELNFLYR